MTVNELKRQVKKHNPQSHFFDRETMRAFGDTMRNYGVKMVEVELDDAFDQDGRRIVASVWELYNYTLTYYTLIG